jgi:hypothetical protein
MSTPRTRMAPGAGTQAPVSAMEPAATDPTSWAMFGARAVTIARFVGFDDADRFLVARTASEPPMVAASVVALHASEAGIGVVIGLQDGEAMRPIILGRLHERRAAATAVVRMDGDRLVLQAEREIELRCGEASIVLTKAGKVLIKGAYVCSKSSGANRVRGAYVELN